MTVVDALSYGAAALGLALAAWRQARLWPERLNGATFAAVVTRLVLAGNEARARKLCAAAGLAGVAGATAALLDAAAGGADEAAMRRVWVAARDAAEAKVARGRGAAYAAVALLVGAYVAGPRDAALLAVVAAGLAAAGEGEYAARRLAWEVRARGSELARAIARRRAS